MKRILLSSMLCLVIQMFVSAQISKLSGAISSDTTIFYNIYMNDGNLFTGQIIESNDVEITLKTPNLGVLQLQRSQIDKIKSFHNATSANKKLEHNNYLNGSRYFYGPSGYGLKKGEAYYQNVWVFFNNFTYGFTDNFSCGFNMVPLFLLQGPTPVWITPKFSFSTDNSSLSLGAGGLFGTTLSSNDYDTQEYGIVYGSATLGTRENNLTVGLGYGYEGDGFSNKPTLSLSASAKLSKKSFLITENYFFNKIALMTIGGRTVTRAVNIDYFFLIPIEKNTDFAAVPMLGLVIPIDFND